LVDADVYWTLAAVPFNFYPPEGKYSNYSFQEYERDLYYYMEDYGYYSEIIAEGNATTDETGRAGVDPATDLSKYKPATFTLRVGVTDLSGNRYMADKCSWPRSMVYPGLKPEVYVGREGKPMAVQLAALDWAGNPCRARQCRWRSLRGAGIVYRKKMRMAISAGLPQWRRFQSPSS